VNRGRVSTGLAVVLAAAVATGAAVRGSGGGHTSAARTTAHALPASLAAAVSAAAGANAPSFAAERRGHALVARGGGLTTTFGAHGLRVQLRDATLSMRASGLGRAVLHAVGAPRATSARNRVSYARRGVAEWYRNGPLGLEQGFTLDRRPTGTGALRLALSTRGLTPHSRAASIVFGDNALIYGGLSAADATGRSLPATLRLSGRRIVIRVEDTRARYPVTIDPFLQAGNRIVAGGEVGNGWFGFRVALSADGNTALVGGHIDNSARGAAWVFKRSGSVWSQEAKLAPTDEVGNGEFGSSVALSADGTTALVGGRSDDGGKGAAWVFVRDPRLTRFLPWRRQGAKLTADFSPEPGETKQFGASVDLTNDGNTALIGAPSSSYPGGANTGYQGGLGAAWIFTRSGGTWTKKGPLMNPFYSADAQLGASVALSGDGSVALLGAPGNAGGRGAVWTFVDEVGFGYFQPTANGPLPPANLTGPLGFGQSVTLSEDGKTALVGAPLFGQGIAWAYVSNPARVGSWTLQRGFIPLDVAGKAALGSSVALSADGDTALIGGPQDASGRGAMWSYVRSGTNWDQLGTKKVEAGGEVGAGTFAASVALAADGHSSFVGAPKHDGGVGAVWSFVDRPTVTALAPPSGPTAGGTKVTLAGTGFKHASGVKFGSVAATSFEILSPALMTAVAPPQASATVDVTVSNSGGTSQPTAADRFTYGSGGPPPPPPPTADTKPPTTPAPLRGSFRARALLLRWKASRDNVGVDHYELFRDGVLRKRISGRATRIALARFVTRKATLFTLQALDAAKNRSDAATLRVIRRARPAGVPRAIPAWARKLYAWQTHGQHGKRPATPAKLPHWYARWKAWQLQPYAFRR